MNVGLWNIVFPLSPWRAQYLSLLSFFDAGNATADRGGSLHVKTKPGSENGCSSQQRLPLASCSSSLKDRKAIPFYKTEKHHSPSR